MLFVGDGVTDVAAGQAAGTATLLLETLKPYVGTELDRMGVWPDWNATTIADARKLIESLITANHGREEKLSVNQERKTFSQNYLKLTARIAKHLDVNSVEAVVEELRATRDAGGRVFVAGNGGGAAHASHFTADIRTLAGIQAYCVADNTAEVTARTNDHGWAAGYAGWLTASRVAPEDLLFVISVGGGSVEHGLSENLVATVDTALAAGARISGFVGPDGGYVAKHASSCVRIPVPPGAGVTVHTEGFQSVLSHLMVAHPLLRVGAPTWEQRTEGRSDA